MKMDKRKPTEINTYGSRFEMDLELAELLGLSDEIGTIEPGKAADIIAVETNPLTDITALQHVRFVMRHGVAYKQP